MLSHDLQSLRIFLAACELRSLSKAAEQHHIAVSAASRRIQLLEHEAGSPLVVRRPHGIEPTAAGLTMMRYARDVLRLGDKLSVSMEEHRGGTRGYVRVCASSSVLVQCLADDLSTFAKGNPDIKIDLEERPTTSTIEAVRHKQADLGLIVRGVETAGLMLIDYNGDELVVALPKKHPLTKRRELTFEDLVGEDFVSLENGTAVHRLVSDRARERGHLMRLRMQVRSFEVMSLLIGQGLGVGIMPSKAARPMTEGFGLKLVKLAEPWAQRQFAICYRMGEILDAPCRRLIDHLTASTVGASQG
ncbi:LysR family transcriptional regulator [Rhodoplanes sp. Z2-YC6860]|uniref:LysR family transcriptional regulator n=1 Tax=Rhodoplanes sp. Z2-YC6860 TaxID=674703 RepID=UPI00078D0868|nr:LysR family transcriptional regulator [Rhodoplanes sp. Z2-YC6860]AMN44008.1 LysR family transcriptional regulator [Rhodoplanes sp. Z2-YC6860]